MSSTEQALRTRFGIFLNAVNDINSLGFEEVYTTPPPNFPTARAMVVEIESEESTRADGAGYVGDAHANKRIFNLKIACIWGEVDPSDQAQGIEEKVYTIKRAIEQSSWLLNEDNGVVPEFEEIHVIGINKRYNPVGYMEGGIISLKLIYHEAWTRDNSLVIIAKPDIASGYSSVRGWTDLTWTLINSGGITGFKVYLSTTNSKPTTPTATLPISTLTYSFHTNTGLTTYYMWICSYNGMMEVSSGCSVMTDDRSWP